MNEIYNACVLYSFWYNDDVCVLKFKLV